MSESWGRSRRYRAPKQESYQQPRGQDLWPRDWQPQPQSHARHGVERKRERTRRLKQLQAEAEDRILRQLAEERRLFEERARLREYELRQQEEEALYHDEQQALYEDEQAYDEFAYDDIPTPRVRSHYSSTHQNTAPYDLTRDQDRYRLQKKIEMDRRKFNEYYPGRQFDEELALQEESAEDELPAEFPIIISFGKVQRELIFVPGMAEAELLDYIGEAFPDLPLNLLNGLRPHGEGWAVPLDACCEQPEFLFRNPQLALALHASAGQTSYEENTEEEEEEEEVYEDETQEDEVVFDEREFFMTQEESDAVEALIEARDPAVQLAYEAYPQLSKLVNAFVRIIRMLTVPQEVDGQGDEEEEEEEQAEPEDDAFDSLLTKTIDWMVKQKLINDAQAQYLLDLALSHDPDLLDDIRQTASLEDLIQHLRAIANQEPVEERATERSQVPRVEAEVLHTVFEKLTNEDVDDDVMTAAMDLITRNDPEAMRAIWAYADHRDWSHLLQTLEALVEARKDDPEAHKTEMHQELRDQILAMRARILAHRQVLEDKRAAHQQNAARDGTPDEEGEKLEHELSRISKQLEELDTLLQNQLSQLDNAAQGLDTAEQDADLDGLKNLVAVLSMDPSIGASEARWVKKFIEEMNSDFLDAYFEFQEHQSYDQYKERLLELIRSAEGVETEPEGDDDLDEPADADPADEFAQKVLKLLYKGQLLKSKERQLLARLVELKDPFVMDAFEQLNVHNDWNQLHEALMSRLSLASGALNGNVEEDEEEYEWEGDEGDSLQED